MRYALILLAFCSICRICSAAVVVNGSFETGISGWTIVGSDADSTGLVYDISPTDSANQGRLITSGNVASDSALELELGLVAGRLDTLDGGAAPSSLNGTAIFQTVMGVAAGDELRFDWQFLTNENAGFLGNNDFAFWSLTGGSNPVPGAVLAKALTSQTLTGAAGFSFKSNPGAVSFFFASAGDYKLGFGVVNVQSSATESGLLLDNVRIISAVPEPSSLVFLGLAGSALCFRRRQRNR